MKFYLLFIILVPSLATKEYSEDISQLLDNPDLILELVKRLGSDNASSGPQKKFFPDKHSRGPYVPVVHGDSRSCKTRLYKKTIIRTEDSKNEGATFLGSAENVDTNAKCLQKCCSTQGCDLAVYENKTKHNCYLFKCRDDKMGKSNCKFDNHADYLSTTLSSMEEDIGHTASISNNKDGKNEDSLGADLEKVTEQSKPVPAEPKPTPKPTQLPHSVALGRWCQFDVSCEDPHAVCFKGACQCQQTYYQKNGFCREVCLRDQVECKRRGTARVGPDCIPKSQVCDGTTQCADGSDERECKTASVVDKQSQPWQQKSQPRPDGDRYHDGTGYDYSQETSNSVQDKHVESDSGDDKGGTGGRQSNKDNIKTNTQTDNTDIAYIKNKGKAEDYEDYSSDVDKELEAVTVTQTDRPIVRPTFHPTKPVVSWYGKSSSKEEEKSPVDNQENKAGGGSRRVHRVDTTVDESSSKGADDKSVKQDLPSPSGDRPEALPQPTQRVNKQMTNAPLQQTMPKAEPSQAYPKGSERDKPFKPSVSSQSVSKDRNSNADSKLGYQNFNRPYSTQSKGRQPPRTQKTKSPSDIPSQDYDSNLYGLGQQRPYPMRRPQPSWPKGNFRKYPDNSFNHPYLGGYNYDYNDYDPYLPAQGQDFSRQYGNHDNSRYPLNSYDGGYQEGGPNAGYTPPHDNWDEKPNPSQSGDMSSSSDNAKTGDKDTSKPTEDKTDSSENKDIGEPSGTLTNENTDTEQVANENTGDKQVANENTDNMQVANENTDKQEPKQTDTNKDKTDNNQDKDSGKDKPTENESGKDSESAPTEVKTTAQPDKHPDVEVVDKEEEETVFVTKEKVIVASPTDNAQGPIVALSLGLAITLMLLVFVGCRLRNVRHRLRKGRPLHSNEADYLINGMYL